MNFLEALKKAKESKGFIRRDAWSSSRASIIFDYDLNAWYDAFGRPFTWSNADTNARHDADDWMVLSEGQR